MKFGKAFKKIGIVCGIAFTVILGGSGPTLALTLMMTIFNPRLPEPPMIILPIMGIILGLEIAAACFYILGDFLDDHGY
jgi:uncharacterized membrane protein (DUF106 family)